MDFPLYIIYSFLEVIAVCEHVVVVAVSLDGGIILVANNNK